MDTKKPSTQPEEGAELQKMRERVGLNQIELAERAGVSRNLISMLEVGKRNFTNKTREKIYRVLIEAEQERKKAPDVVTTLSTLAEKKQRESGGSIPGAWSLAVDSLSHLLWSPDKVIEEQKKLIEGLQKENELLRAQLATATELVEAYQHRTGWNDWKEAVNAQVAEIARLKDLTTLLVQLLDVETVKGLASKEAEELREQIAERFKSTKPEGE